MGTFHAGEIAQQREVGVADRMGQVGPLVIRDHMPEQHRDFFPLLPFLLVGSVDERFQPTASVLAGEPGFVWSPDPRTLRVDARPLAGDPLAERLAVGAPVGLLGLQPHTRRRNRANGRVAAVDAAGFTVAVEQSFGNCPRFIHAREATYAGDAGGVEVRESSFLGAADRALVAAADTFFLASAHPDAAAGADAAFGVDVSHRGGPPGFAAFVGDDTFLVPDFRGNHLFNTLGNLRVNPRAGVLFIDRVGGDLLQLEAVVDAVAADHPHAGPEPTGRVLRFRVRRVRRFVGGSRLRFAAER